MSTFAARRPSQLNALKFGDAIDGFLPCKRMYCIHEDVCREHPWTQQHGFPEYGSDCMIETLDHEAFVESAKTKFSYALEWLSEAEYEAAIERYSMLTLRMRRILLRMTGEGLVRETVLPNGTVWLRENYSCHRYWPTVAREIDIVLGKLLPPEPAEPDEPLVLPIQTAPLPATPDLPQQPRSHVDPTTGWFDLPRPWEHEPGKPQDLAR